MQDVIIQQVYIALVSVEKFKKGTPFDTDQGKSVFCGHQEIIRLQGKRGLLKILPKNNKVDGEVGVEKNLLTNMNVEKAGVSSMPTKRGYLKHLFKGNKMEPQRRVQQRKEKLPLPQWLKDEKSEVANLEGWQVFQIPRTSSGRKDKYYTHRDYARHTFRSKREVKTFLKNGEVKGKRLLLKVSADPSSGQNSGHGVGNEKKDETASK